MPEDTQASELAPPSAELARSNARLRVLAEVSHAFATVVTDYRTLLKKIARITADLIGDGCLVTLIGEDHESLFNTASAHRDPGLEADYKAYLQGMGVSKTTSATVTAAVVRTGTPKLVPEVHPETLVAQTDDALKPLVARLNVHSFVVVPIRARETIIGSLSMLRSRPGHAYTPDDLTLLQDLADRAGLAIDNSRLYDQLERRVRQRTAELEAVNKELEAFSYSVAHDLRAPLRSIDGFSQALLEDFGDRLEPPAIAHLQRVRGAAQRMAQLIDDLLKLSRVTRAELNRERVDLSSLARSELSRLRETQPERVVDIIVEDGVFAEADPQLVEVVLTNLLGNAWKFTGKRPQARIEFAARASDGQTTFLVSDNGAGFDPTYAGKLFGTFQRLHAAHEYEGTGVGLATVERIVRRHGGRVWAESKVGAGATFFFTLEPTDD